MTDDWMMRIAAVWANADRFGDDELIAAIDALAAERPDGDAIALLERGGARDSGGRPHEAAAFYRAALAAGLPDDERARCTIQLASTLRNLGDAEGSLALLRAEFSEQPDSPYAAAASAFASLALASLGRPTEGLAAVLHALAPTLPAYQRSVRAYADALLDPEP